MHDRLRQYLPVFEWGRGYNRETLANDLMAAVVVTIMLIPQSLAYAMLAGLPPEAGLYASIVPILLYSLFGTSRTLAVGPVAVISLMTAASIGQIAEQGTMGYGTAALTLAFLSGIMLLAMGVLRLGFLAHFISHPVIAGFITASGLLIAASQLKSLSGIDAHGHTLPEIIHSLVSGLGTLHGVTLIIGVGSAAFLFWVRSLMEPFLVARGLAPSFAKLATRAGPVAAIAVTTIMAWWFGLDERGVNIVGSVPQALPPFTLPDLTPELIGMLLVPSLLIAIIGFVESVSVAQTLAARKRQRIDPNQELIGLGAANIGAAFSGGFPVTGGFARSVVNDDAGAQTPAAGAFTAIGLAIAAVALTPLLYYLPRATLAATIIVAVLSLVDFTILKRTWRFSKTDFTAVAATIGVTLVFGVETGVSAGVAFSVMAHLYRTSKPHMAIVGQVPGTEHFRNVNRHEVITRDDLLTVRVDESLYFANARFLEDRIYDMATEKPALKNVVLMCPAVNDIDMSALESLESLNRRLKEIGVTFHLSEVKGPVMDKLKRTRFADELSGDVFLTQHQAVRALAS